MAPDEKREKVGWPLHFHNLAWDLECFVRNTSYFYQSGMGHNLTFRISIMETLVDASNHHHVWCLCKAGHVCKVAGLRPANLLKKRLWKRRFPVNFVKLLRIPFYIEHLWMTASNHYFSCLILSLCEHIISCMTDILKYSEVSVFNTPANFHRYPNLDIIYQ